MFRFNGRVLGPKVGQEEVFGEVGRPGLWGFGVRVLWFRVFGG